MLQSVFNKMQRILEENPVFFSGTDAKATLEQLIKDSKEYKSIDFYHPHAKEQLENLCKLVIKYSLAMTALCNQVKSLPSSPERKKVLDQLEEVLGLLAAKERKLNKLTEQIPNGMIDVKRALRIAPPYSKLESENEVLLKQLKGLKDFLTTLNTEYTSLIQRTTTLDELLWSTTSFYWIKLKEYKKLLTECCLVFNGCKLTDGGEFIFLCLGDALNKIPSIPAIDTPSSRARAKLMKGSGFFASEAMTCCKRLSKLGKTYFHLPHNNDRYHFDYNPTEDLCGTGGDCFGQCMTFIASLKDGEFKVIRPPMGLINYQLDQTRPWVDKKEYISSAETEVSAGSTYDKLQWNDLKTVFSDDAGFLPGFICGLSFSMNAYTRSTRDFTAGHIAVVAKLDPKNSPYKFVVYEKELGAFGLNDEESLGLVMNVIMDMYSGMNYSRVKVTKYAEATGKTYELLRSIQAVSAAPTSVSEYAGAVFSAGKEEAGRVKEVRLAAGEETVASKPQRIN